jgi:hypothetical protein
MLYRSCQIRIHRHCSCQQQRWRTSAATKHNITLSCPVTRIIASQWWSCKWSPHHHSKLLYLWCFLRLFFQWKWWFHRTTLAVHWCLDSWKEPTQCLLPTRCYSNSWTLETVIAENTSLSPTLQRLVYFGKMFSTTVSEWWGTESKWRQIRSTTFTSHHWRSQATTIAAISLLVDRVPQRLL